MTEKLVDVGNFRKTSLDHGRLGRSRLNSQISILGVSKQAFQWPQRKESAVVSVGEGDHFSRISGAVVQESFTSRPCFVFFILSVLGIV